MAAYNLILGGRHNQKPIDELITPDQPLGPIESDGMVTASVEAFQLLYTQSQPNYAGEPYILGRKGSGKTTFITGTAIAEGRYVYPVYAGGLYHNLNRFRAEYAETGVRLEVENLGILWSVLLEHIAMLALCELDGEDNALNMIWAYVSGYGDPLSMDVPVLSGHVLHQVIDDLKTSPLSYRFKDSCSAVYNDTMTFAEARVHLYEFLQRDGEFGGLDIVIDNLEGLTAEGAIEENSATLQGLFRCVTDDRHVADSERWPFGVRFAFPAEVFPSIELISSNPDKDFARKYMIGWSTRQLIPLVGNRLHTALRVLRNKEPIPVDLSYARAEGLLLSRLPEKIENTLGSEEDLIPYLIRHTHLIPRHLLALLNVVFSRSFAAAGEIVIPSSDDVVKGVEAAELTLAQGILSAHKSDHPRLGKVLRRMKNRVELASPMAVWHEEYNRAGIRDEFSLSFNQFIEGAIEAGILGRKISNGTDEKYIEAEFQYNVVTPIQPIAGRDDVCIHPLFVSLLFDKGRIEELAGDGESVPIYPRGVLG